jgi:UMF1 family MFS transporter
MVASRQRLDRWLAHVGLGRPELRAWALYDWGNSGFVTTIVAAVFPIYFAQVAAADLPRPAATVRFTAATTVALLLAAVLSPQLGRLADRTGARVPLLRASTGIAVAASAGLALVGRGDWRLGGALFIVANVALSASMVFYDALLPAIADRAEVDRVSSAGYALGYVGGGALLGLDLLLIHTPHWFGVSDSAAAARLSFLSVAVWWLLFALPLLRRGQLGVPTGPGSTSSADRRLGLAKGLAALRSLRPHHQALLMLVAFLLYSDGIGTVIRLATLYGAEIGISGDAMIAALLVTQFVGVPSSFLFGALGTRIGAKRAIFLGLGVYLVITVLAVSLRSEAQFFLLAFLVGTVQGGTQALSRSLFTTLIPSHRAGEFFGFYAIADKFAGVLGPAVFGITTALTGTSRAAVATTALFFLAGGAVLAFVRPPPASATGE